jgi:uncharacterized delta-60 repeat protein
MKKRIKTISILIFISLNLIAQPPDTLWTKTFGGPDWEAAYSVQQTTDGGFIVAGQTNSYGTGGNDMYLIKTDDMGDILWTRTYGSPGSENAYSVQQTLDGGYILAGKTTAVNGGSPDVYLVKTNDSGDTLWTRTYGGEDDDDANSVIQTDDGYYITVGNTRSYGQGNSDFYFVETSPAADTVWDDTFGGYANDYGQVVQETDDGYIMAGSTSNFGAGNFDAWLVRIDYEYEIFWHKTFGGAASDRAYDVQVTSDGGFIGAGYTESFGPGDKSYFLFKANANGDSLWARTYGGEDRDECKSVKQTPDGGYIMAGSTKSFGAGNYDWYIVRTDPNGDTLWTKTLGGTAADECSSVQLTNDGGYIIAGSTRSFGAGNSDIWLIKLAPDLVKIEKHENTARIPQLLIFPNPLTNQTCIKYTLVENSMVYLCIIDLYGKEEKVLCNLIQQKGSHELFIDSSDLPAGIYFCVLKTSEGTQTQKITKLN